MNTQVYFKDSEGKLNKYDVVSDDVQEAVMAVKEMLDTTKQAYLGQAVMGVVIGGKA